MKHSAKHNAAEPKRRSLNNCLGKWLKRGVLALVSLSLFASGSFLLAVVFVDLPEDQLHPPQAYRFTDDNGDLLAVILGEDSYYRMHVPVDRISPLFIKTLLLHEDQYFYEHAGINPLAIVRAMSSNLSAGRIVSGGSTITMQLARMLDRKPRTLWAKGIEALRATKLEWQYSKDEILAHYLAIAPYGGNIEGIEAAAFAYFNKSSAHLSIGEIALLVALPQSPNRYRPDRNPQQARVARNVILNKMLAGKLITANQYQRAKAEPIAVSRKRPNNLIPHLAWRMLAEDRKDRRLYQEKTGDQFPKADRQYHYKTTINANMQMRTQNIMRQHIRSLKNYSISNAAVVIIDNETRDVKTSIGSLDYFDKQNLGANDGTRSARSPGSTLKPFLYGLAIDHGLISERTVLYDVPMTVAGYSPQNYSLDYLGPIQAKEALAMSLNVIPVKLSQQLGINKLHYLLAQGGISTLHKDPQYYGLPLVLGGVDVKLDELANLYASLANNGVYRPHRIDQKYNTAPDKAQLLSPGASWLVMDMLTDVNRPDFPASWEFSRDRPTVAWKTGTSYGNRDAWSIGVTPKYTVGVWVGNFDAQPSVGLIGSQAAAPLLFDVLQGLELSNEWFAKPKSVQQRQVCSVCGQLANEHCPSLVTEYYLTTARGPATQQICEIPQPIMVDTRTGLQASEATPKAYLRQQIHNVWPAPVAAFLLERGVPVRNVPPYDYTNMAGQKYYPPKILNPLPKTTYYRRPDRIADDEHAIKLSAAVTNRVRKVSWFLDGKLLKTVDPKQDVIINPAPGKYTVTLTDGVGGSASVKLVVKDYRDLLAQR